MSSAILKKKLNALHAILTAFRETVGFDLTEPQGFSEYLIALYGIGSDDVAEEIEARMKDVQRAVFSKTAAKTAYRAWFETWLDALAPEGIVLARGLHSLGFLRGDDVVAEILSRQKETNYYTMNSVVASRFATAAYRFSNQQWAQAAGRIYPKAAEYSDGLIEGEKNRYGRSITHPGKLERIADDPPFPPKVAAAFAAVETSVILVTKPLFADSILSWGGDSESGDTNEAELHVGALDEDSFQHAFVLSRQRLYPVTNKRTQDLYGLTQHRKSLGREIYFEPVALTLHTDVVYPGKIVKVDVGDRTWQTAL